MPCEVALRQQQPVPFASLLRLRFIGQRMIVCDINGDYIGGGMELPDGFAAEITRRDGM